MADISSIERRKLERLFVAASRHRRATSAQVALAAMGGFEIAMLCGAMIQAASERRVVLVDGFVAGTAALVARALVPAVADYLVYAHRAAEPGHRLLLIHLQANPLLVNDELGLKSKYGLDYFYPEAPMGLLLKDFRHFLTYIDVDKTCQEIAKYSEKDADNYREFVNWGARMMPMLLQGMFNVPIPMGPFMAMMESNEDGRRMLDLMFRSPLQIVDELFETDILKIHLLKWVSEGILQFPDDMGTGFGLIIMILLVHFYLLVRLV